MGLPWLGEVCEKSSLQETCAEIVSLVGERELVGVIVGGETGVILADELSEALGLRTNGTACKGRRDKSEQQKLVKASGLRSTREASGTCLADVRAFLESEPMPCIVKPTESCGSDGVKKCKTIQEAEAHFELLMRSQKKAGAQDCAVICQEFLAGQEYVVDHVSRDGKHKTVMVWVYLLQHAARRGIGSHSSAAHCLHAGRHWCTRHRPWAHSRRSDDDRGWDALLG